GLMAWNTFSAIFSRVSSSLLGNAQMISKIYFPRLILRLSTAAAAMIDFGVSLAMMSVMLLFFRIWPGWGVLLLPAWLIILVTMALGLGLLGAALMVRYRDVAHIIP